MDMPLFPEITPYDTRTLDVGSGHSLYLEQAGNPAGLPALFLHGGPGSGCQPMHRQLFDPARFRAILFDQRGAGRSTPRGRLVDNTTQDLIGDIERIRTLLGVERWVVVGGSWGATLALAYAQTHPGRVLGMALRGIFLGTAAEWTWAFRDGPRIFRPELWDRLVSSLPVAERADPCGALVRRLADPDPAVHAPAACAWGDLERALSELKPTLINPRAGDLAAPLAGRAVPSTPYVEAHYFRNGSFLQPGQLLRDAGRLASIPGILVHGRYDVLCPPEHAFALHTAWPGSELRWAETSGHAITEAGIRAGLLAAIADLGAKLAP